MKKLVFIISLVLFSTGVLFFFAYLNFYDGKLHLVMCSVGQGDAIFLRTPGGADVLIDGGPDKSVLSCISSRMPFWDKTIEAIILTHPDADHITGAVDVIKRYNVSALFTQSNSSTTDIYKLFQMELAEKKLSAKYVEAGDKIKIDDKVTLDILSPASNQPDPAAKGNSLNVYSVVVRLNYGNFSALFTGDAPASVMDRIAQGAGRVNVLKVPHHGSKTGMSEGFLNVIKPEISLISVGVSNRYGHPSQISLNLLERHGVKAYRTDKNGEIEILSNGLTYSLKLQKQ